MPRARHPARATQRARGPVARGTARRQHQVAAAPTGRPTHTAPTGHHRTTPWPPSLRAQARGCRCAPPGCGRPATYGAPVDERSAGSDGEVGGGAAVEPLRAGAPLQPARGGDDPQVALATGRRDAHGVGHRGQPAHLSHRPRAPPGARVLPSSSRSRRGCGRRARPGWSPWSTRRRLAGAARAAAAGRCGCGRSGEVDARVGAVEPGREHGDPVAVGRTRDSSTRRPSSQAAGDRRWRRHPARPG